MALQHKICPTCGIEYAAPEAFFTARSEGRASDQTSWYCPNGHSLTFKNLKIDEIRQERDRLKQQLAQKEDEIAEARRLREAAEREAKRVKKRATAGVCQCCNRTFSNVARHMATKHPNVKPKLVAEKVS